MIIYGIRHITTRKPLGISIFSNEDAEFCNPCGARFETGDFFESIYNVINYKTAQKALKENPEWYNASLESPEWPSDFLPANYEIFEINIT